jgi:hypothetical protein
MANVATMAIETEWKIDYNGWIITVRACNYRQAKYRAWMKFKYEFGTSFRDFVYSARQY